MNYIKKPAEDDWRRQGQELFLKGKKLILREYYSFRPGWDHDHCEFCGVKFSQQGVKIGYSTEDGYHWICQSCFSDFRDEFNWQIEDGVDNNGQ